MHLMCSSASKLNSKSTFEHTNNILLYQRDCSFAVGIRIYHTVTGICYFGIYLLLHVYMCSI